MIAYRKVKTLVLADQSKLFFPSLLTRKVMNRRSKLIHSNHFDKMVILVFPTVLR